MHALCEYIDKELKKLERKAEQSGDLSERELTYGKDLAKFKTALLTNKAMEENDSYNNEYRGDMSRRMYSRNSYGDDMSYERGRGSNVRRDSMGRYSNDGYSHDDAREDLMLEVREFMKTAPEEDKHAARVFMNHLKKA
jgi:hypothetical protein